MENPEVKRLKTVQLEDHVRCCLDSHTLQDPYLLMCCHLYCKSCLPQLQVKDGYICQVCQLTTPTERLIPSDFMLHILDKCVDKHEPECSHCDKHKAPDLKCKECQVFLCSDQCKARHLRLYRNHTLLPYSKETDQLVINPVLFCPDHGDKRLEMNCKTCQKIICEQCSEERHEPHEIGAVKVGIKHCLMEITPLRKTLTDTESVFKIVKCSAEDKMDLFNDSVEKELDDLQVYKENLIAQIEQEYTEMKSKIIDQQEELNKYYVQVINEEKNKLTCVRRALEWSRLVEVHAESECLLKTLQTELIPQLRALCESLDQEQSPMKIRKPEDVKLNMMMFYKPPDQQFFSTSQCHIEEYIKTELLYVDKAIDTGNLAGNLWKMVDLNQMIKGNNNLIIGDLEWELKLPRGMQCFSLTVMNDQILAPLDFMNTLLVFSLLGKLMLTKKFPEDIRCRGIQKLTDSELILATTDGLYLLDSTSLDITQQIYSKGDFCSGVTVNNGEIVGLDETNNELVILKCLGGRKILQKQVKLQGYEQITVNDSVVKSGPDIYIASRELGKVYRYNIIGELLGQSNKDAHIKIQYPRLQGVDGHGHIILLEAGEKVVRIMNPAFECSSWDISGVKAVRVSTLCITQDTLVLVAYRGEKLPWTIYKHQLIY